MKHTCSKCKCNRCGDVHKCEIIMDKIILLETSRKCDPILKCSNFNKKRDYTECKNWECDVRKNIE